MPGKKTILIVDDHPVLRRGLSSMIESEPDLTVCGEAGSYDEAIKATAKWQPDLVLVDLALAGRDGLELVKELKKLFPQIPALVLSMHEESVYAERALRAGAWGFVSKDQLDETVLVAIRSVLDGETYMSEELKTRFADGFVRGRALEDDTPLSTLSDRELEVFRQLGEGLTTRQVAKALQLSVKTIESHREHIKQKLGLDTAAELIHRATQWVAAGPND